MLVDKSKISHWLLLFVHQHLYIMHLSMLSPRKGPGGGGILTFSEKMSQIPHPRDNIVGQKYQKPPPQECNVCTTHLSFSDLSQMWEGPSNAVWVFSKMAELFSGNLVPRAFPSLPGEG